MTRDNDLARSLQTGGNGHRSSNPLTYQMRAVDDAVTTIADWLDTQGEHSLAEMIRRREPWAHPPYVQEENRSNESYRYAREQMEKRRR